MAFDTTPWMIAGGAQHSADLGRTLAFAATSGEEGVVLPDSLKVSALPTPGASVRIGPGACIIPNRSLPAPNYGEQSYIGRAGSDTDLAVPATGGVGRSDLVVVRVEDPQYAPWQTPVDPVAATYFRPFLIQNVASNIINTRQLNLGYPAIALARLDIPANTSTITGSMVKDVREIAQPRSKRVMLTHYPTAKNGIPAGSVNVYTYWPATPWQLTVPLWATRAVISATIGGAKVGHPDTSVNGDIDTSVLIELGNFQGIIATEGTNQEWLTVVSPNTGLRGYMRGDITVGGTVDCSLFRGNVVNVDFGAAIKAGLGEIYVDTNSVLICDIEFQERPV